MTLLKGTHLYLGRAGHLLASGGQAAALCLFFFHGVPLNSMTGLLWINRAFSPLLDSHSACASYKTPNALLFTVLPVSLQLVVNTKRS